jgi:hydrogenase expression/formation protein HypE
MQKILLAHGGGGEETGALIREVFQKHFSNDALNALEDAAVLSWPTDRIAFTTDSFTVDPPFFSGGDIGKLAVAGTVNDLGAMGARPRFLSAGFIIEEGFHLKDLATIAVSMAREASLSGLSSVTGDTKVMPRGDLKGIVINTSGVGEIFYDGLSASAVATGDTIIVSGTVGDHGACIMASREGIDFKLALESDCASLWPLVASVLDSGARVHAMRDPTRGGLAAVLNEWARQSAVEIEVAEEAIPVHNAVRGACELLGIEPTHLASEGRVVLAVNAADAEAVLGALQSHSVGEGSRVIGTVLASGRPRVVLRSAYNTRRIMDPPSGEILPRIC